MSHPHFEIYRPLNEANLPNPLERSSVWRWRLVGANGEIVASGESYVSRANALRAVNTIIALSAEADIVTVE